ncbi:MAG: T9SS type A sorting domain-containing protein, partial [Bacteroidales bacterium]|nr:T9SS type A sorting domain-containing protein [Bacteroidales bacterium]
ERTNYNVRVRGKCSWDTEFGEWSEWLDLFTGAHRNDPPQSVSNLERFTQMMPNPARGMVTVLSSYRLSRVVVYDLQGHAVLEQEDDGLATTIDVSGLAKGVYVVAIHTHAGIATKRLAVEGN